MSSEPSLNLPGESWWRLGLYFSCLSCGRCCGEEPGTVSFTDEEGRAIAGALGMGIDEFESRYVWRRYGKPSLRERANYDCVFLERPAMRCAIYAARPRQCGEFPFWPEVLSSRESWNRFARACAGMNQGAFHDADEISCRLKRQIEAKRQIF
jgi:Fe-S-cluster containining protein